jgi:hypothetical protein
MWWHCVLGSDALLHRKCRICSRTAGMWLAAAEAESAAGNECTRRHDIGNFCSYCESVAPAQYLHEVLGRLLCTARVHAGRLENGMRFTWLVCTWINC